MHKTNWKNILKMPVPIDSRSNRDEDYKQAIIQYEQSVIEPKLTSEIQRKSSEENLRLIISQTERGEGADKISSANGPGGIVYLIGYEARAKLGSNQEYINRIIGEVYTAEGWTVEVSTFNGHPSIVMSQELEQV